MRSLFVLFVILSVALADSPLCRILHGVGQQPKSPMDNFADGTIYVYVETWMTGGDCSQTGNTFDLPSYPLNWGAPKSTIKDITFEKLSIIRHVHATYNPDTQAAAISAGVDFNITARHASDPNTAIQIRGTVGFDVSHLPLALAGRYDPVWHGEMHTVSSGSYALFDNDVFDGHPAFVLTSRLSGGASSTALTNTDKILALAADANLRLVHFDAVPTIIGNDISARLAFMRPSALSPSQASSSYSQTDNYYSVVWNGANCVGDKCDAEIGWTLSEFAAADSRCTNPVIIPESVHARLWTTMLINSTSAQLHSAHAMSRAIFRCSSNGEDGWVSIALEAISTLETSDHAIDVGAFMNDKRSAVLMMKNGGFKLRGYRTGYVKVNGDIYTASRDDIFGPSFGGVFIKDYPLTTNGRAQFLSFMGALINRTGVSGLTLLSFQVLFDDTNFSQVYDNYLERTTLQTQYNLLSYVTILFDGISLVKSKNYDDGVSIALNIRTNTSSWKLQYETETHNAINPYLSYAYYSIASRCGKHCRSFSNPPNASRGSYFLPKSFLVLVGTIDITLSPSGLDDKSVPTSVFVYRSATIH